MAILQKLKEHFSRDSVTLDLQDIQALILRSRPEPYVGVHAMLHFDEAAGARNLLGRLAPHVASADNWSEDLDFWIGAALSFEGLKALGVPDAQLKTFPLPFQQGMAARAEQLRDFGPNAPENWEDVFKPGNCHLALTIYAVDDDAPYDIFRLYQVTEESARLRIARDIGSRLRPVLDALKNVPHGASVDSLSFEPSFFDFEDEEYLIETPVDENEVGE